MEGWRRQDPTATPQLAVPVTVPNRMFHRARAKNSPYHNAVADLALIAFYYLLRVGEYTQGANKSNKVPKNNRKRTVNFRVKDVGFFKNGKQFSRHNNLEQLLQADSCTLKISNQKNGRMGETIHHQAIKTLDECPVKALARRIHHILSNGGDGDTPICTYYKNNTPKLITPRDMIKGVRQAVTDLHLRKHGIAPDLVGVHSLRAGGAMAMKLHGISDTTIMKMGRWSSLTFLEYVHNQIGHLSDNVSFQMSQELPLDNIAAIERV